MKVNELRIGNLVLYNDLYCKIIGIDKIGMDEDRVLVEYHNGETDYCYIGYIEPILLTEEFFLKNGFEKDPMITQYSKEIDEFLISYIDGANGCLLSIQGKKSQFYKYDIKYIHELQNAYYCLTNEELNVEL